MAQHAEMANFTSGLEELPRKLEVLAGHCADAGHDMSTINKTALCTVVIAPTMEAAEELRNGFLRGPRLNWETLDDEHPRARGSSPRRGRSRHRWRSGAAADGTGLDGLTFNLPANGHDPDAVAHTVGVIKTAIG